MKRLPRSHPLCIAIDTGGTFTDCVWMERGRIRMMKLFSTPQDPSQAIAQALEKIGVKSAVILLHGTTVGTNTLLQRKGAPVALVTTAGFEDVIEIGRQARPKLYDFFFDKLEPLVPADLRFGVAERTASDGEILGKPSAQDLKTLSRQLHAAHPEAIAISLLFSFANPENENAVADALRPLGVPLSVSHQILPEFREYERTSTVVVNAYLQPVMEGYLKQIDAELPPRSRVFVMQSSGGITALESAIREPVRTVLSGPAGGIRGATVMARRSGCDRIISFDMGGTSTDVALAEGEARAANQTEIAGLPVGVPMLDIHTVGAGGGSIARFDAGGALRVGPESAGADPGPICYGRGTQPTVTDAHLILGRLQPQRFLGGEFVLDLERTRRIISEWLRHSGCKLSLEQFASGVIRVINATMERAIRLISVERGFDPREFALVAFGGAGGLHACELAQAIGIPRVILPSMPGALSAFGILVSDVVKDYSRTVGLQVLRDLPRRRLEEEFRALRQKAEGAFRAEGWRGKAQHRLSVDVRYRGQGYELNVPFTRALLADFKREHERRYGYSYPAREMELVTLRLRATMRSVQAKEAMRPAEADDNRDIPPERISIFFDGKKGRRATLYHRTSLRPGQRLAGPALVSEYGATTFVPPGMRLRVDSAENVILDGSPARLSGHGTLA